ncbi:unnamed protein product [Gongylonema pulchrum]|uniref:Uncharacterized protein n=1 Tax=Gongylonema pulchrum TaxID=637853 RepID=A0A3P6SYJ6_9BILA|nr:unnamed protein product [Gongylonema pulchrum]
MGDSAVEERCSGTVKDSLQNKVLDVLDLHTLERSLSEIVRTVRDAESPQKQLLARAVVQSNFIDILTTLISCASNGDTLMSSR